MLPKSDFAVKEPYQYDHRNTWYELNLPCCFCSKTDEAFPLCICLVWKYDCVSLIHSVYHQIINSAPLRVVQCARGNFFLGDCSEQFLLFSICHFSFLFFPSVSLKMFARSRENYQICCIFCASPCFYHSSPFPLV